jgi:hypothetical protein
MSVMLMLVDSKAGVMPAQQAIAEWANFSYKVGSPQWDDQTAHPRPDQRTGS